MSGKVLAWLLEAETPTIRYLTLVDLMGLPEKDERVQEARWAIMSEGPVPAILAAQTEDGNWPGEHSFYTPKYRSTHWCMMLLAELQAAGDDPRFRRGADFMLDATSARLEERMVGEDASLSCFYGNMLRYVCQAGLASDDRTAPVVAYGLRSLQDGPCRCDWNGGYACAWGAARALWGLAALPAEMRSAEVQRAIEQGLEFLLAPGRLPVADYPVPDGGKVHSIWSRLNFPLFYQVDILFVLRVAQELGALDRPGAQEGLEWLEGRRLKNGRWRGSSPYRRNTWPEMGGPEETGRWVTVQAGGVVGAF